MLLTHDTGVTQNSGMTLQKLCALLEARRGEWSAIADHAGLCRRTILRIVSGENVPNMRTVMDLEAALKACRAPKKQRQAA